MKTLIVSVALIFMVLAVRADGTNCAQAAGTVLTNTTQVTSNSPAPTNTLEQAVGFASDEDRVIRHIVKDMTVRQDPLLEKFYFESRYEFGNTLKVQGFNYDAWTSKNGKFSFGAFVRSIEPIKDVNTAGERQAGVRLNFKR